MFFARYMGLRTTELDMPIIPDRLKELRKRGGLSRAKLAAKSSVSRRQITRFENKAIAASAARDSTVNDLAKALDVEPGVLTGEMPMPASNRSLDDERGVPRQVSALLQPEASLACALIKRRYGISRTTLFNAAPLMFVLLAEGSLVWRREKLEEVWKAADRLCSLGVGHLSFAQYAYLAQGGAGGEEESIRKRDLFGEEVSEAAFELGYDRDTNNPFADYLRHLAAQIDDSDNVEIGEEIQFFGPLENFPKFTVCGEDFAKFTGGSAKLNLAALLGYLHIDRIPEELLAEDALDKRLEWFEGQLEEQLSEEQRKAFEDLLALKIDHLAEGATGATVDDLKDLLALKIDLAEGDAEEAAQ